MMVKFLALVSGCCVAVELDWVELQFPGVPVSVTVGCFAASETRKGRFCCCSLCDGVRL